MIYTIESSKDDMHTSVTKDKETYIRAMRAHIRSRFQDQKSIILDVIDPYQEIYEESTITDQQIDTILQNYDDIVNETITIKDSIWLYAYQAGGRMAIRQLRGETATESKEDILAIFDISFDLSSEDAIIWAENFSAERIAEIDDSTMKLARKLIVESIETGKSWNELKDSLSDLFKSFRTERDINGRTRVDRIAYNELGTAYATGQRTQMQRIDENPALTVVRQRITAGDDRVRPAHRTDGSTWYTMNEPYADGSFISPTDPGCRCIDSYDLKTD